MRILRQVVQLYKENPRRKDLQPNAFMYGIVMSLVDAKKAHQLLREMLPQPQTRHFQMVMNAYAKEGKAQEAEQLLMEMMELQNRGYNHVQPDRKVSTL